MNLLTGEDGQADIGYRAIDRFDGSGPSMTWQHRSLSPTLQQQVHGNHRTVLQDADLCWG
jgi:hypothetical protein